MRARGSKALRALGIVLAVVAAIGLLRLIGWASAGEAGLNLGVFLCPGILAAVFLWVSRPEKEKED